MKTHSIHVLDIVAGTPEALIGMPKRNESVNCVKRDTVFRLKTTVTNASSAPISFYARLRYEGGKAEHSETADWWMIYRQLELGRTSLGHMSPEERAAFAPRVMAALASES